MIAKLAALSVAPGLPEETLTRQSVETRLGIFQRNRPVSGAAATISLQVLPSSAVYSIFTVEFAAAPAEAQVMACLLSTLQDSPPLGDVSRIPSAAGQGAM